MKTHYSVSLSLLPYSLGVSKSYEGKMITSKSLQEKNQLAQVSFLEIIALTKISKYINLVT